MELSAAAPRQLVAELGGLERQVLALAFRLEGSFDYMEQFIIGNMMTDLLPEGTLLLSAEVRTDLFLLVDAAAGDSLEGAVARLRKEFWAFQPKPLRSAASLTGTLDRLPRLYEQAEELLYLADLEGLECLLRCGQEEQPAAHLVDYQAIRDADSYEGILFGLHLACLKLRLMGREQEEIERYFAIVWKMLAGDAPVPKLTLESFADALAACGDQAGTPSDSQSPSNSQTPSGSQTPSDSQTPAGDGDVTIRITWWGGESRHTYTQQLLDLYTQSHPNVHFEASPSGWDGYFDKLSTQAASGGMPDIIQMDYLYITTYANNGTLADLTPYIQSGAIDTSNIDDSMVSSGKIGDIQAGFPLSSSLLAVGYNPSVLAQAGVETPTSDWTWEDWIAINNQFKEKTGLLGNCMGPVEDTNIFNYWVRQHGGQLFSDDKCSLGYDDDSITAGYFQMWKDMMDAGSAPNPDEYSQISTLGLEATPVVTNEAGFDLRWNNYTMNVAKVNDTLEMVMKDGEKGLWLKPGMFFSVAALKQIPESLYESASIDGASPRRIFWSITMPMLTPTIFFNLILQIINGFRVFTETKVVTNGGPMNSTLSYVLYMYQKAFNDFDMGYSCALGWVLVAIIGVATILLFKSQKKWVHYEA